LNINLTLVPAEGFQIPVLRQARNVSGNLRFCPTKFAKGVFCTKKAKTQNASNKQFGKKPAEGKFIGFCFAILLRFRQREQNLAGKRSIGIGTFI